ncbi:cadmium resistance protein CadD (predicted permease) [Mycobacterium frederiksbergense]|uniref:Cadmium resistance protein CadD (Predicted permease) n=1 Tax=Mycolicibacterium frederiksbergense TaxID=117567 RepID=A0ABT6KTJ5_9MYCO|nr:cadmium resistance transporter [Mycolicibacterium frederiksbergense]MDH6194031.1 cadmium resistance protein CadD (predicted permease) [Mycolicibacterium frederiksbergense]
MSSILATTAAATGLYVGTSIDDIVVLAVLNVSNRAGGRPKRWQIWTGQYTGIAALVIISLVAALGLTLVPERWIWMLGLIPLLLGLYKLAVGFRARRNGDEASTVAASGLLGVIGLTIANGGDNIAAYTPVFHTIQGREFIITLAVFTVGVAVWCLAGAWLVSHRKVTHIIRSWGHWIVPAVYILIGLYVFYKAGLFAT